MKLRECLEFGKELGLEDVGEAYSCVRLHAIQMFEYSKIAEELNEITLEYNELYEKGLINCDMLIDDALNIEILNK